MQRADYLQAMGVAVWKRRDLPEAVVPAVEEIGVTDQKAPVPAWGALRSEVSQCRRCELADGRTQTVFGVGNQHADLVVVGEAPGVEEDRQGEPFVGRAGQLLNRMLQAAGLSRDAVYIANIIKCRPPNNRDPSSAEVSACIGYLQQQLDLLAPKVVLCVGKVAAHNLLGLNSTIASMRGQVHNYGPDCLPVVVTYHPAYLLRTPHDKRKSWADLQLVQRLLRTHTAGPVC
jgi:DNA polymerase